MPGLECLNERDLRAFVLGDLPETDSLAVTAHLEACPACEATARRLDRATDPILRGLRLACEVARGADADGMPSTQPDDAVPSPAPAEAVPDGPEGFAILAELGRGGSGVVYLARQEYPGRLVALKMILGGVHGSPEQRARFLREADAIARLRHPGIVQIHGVGRHGDVPFLTLEYLPGGSLARRLDGAPMSPRRAAETVESLARAVEFAHRNGVIHRDLKPSNVLLDEEGRPKVADFGLAKHDRADLTATGMILGTPSYIAPEQASGSRDAGSPADVYALGAILYECLTGRPPFRAASAWETIEQVRSQEPAAPSLVQPGLPRDLGLITLKCLRKEPERRYDSAGQLAEELRLFLDGAPLRHTRPVGTGERLARWCRRNPAWAATIAGIAALLTTVAIGASVMSLRLDGALGEAHEALGRARDAEADSQVKLWESYFAQARASRSSHTQGQRTKAIEAIRAAQALALPPGRTTGDLRTEAIAALVLPDIEDAFVWDVRSEHHFGIELDPRFERFGWQDRDGTAEVGRLADGALLARLPGTGLPILRGLTFSPTGAFVVSRGGPDGRTRLWDLRGPEPAMRLEIASGPIETSPAFDAEERHLALVHAGGVVRVHALEPARRGEEPRRVAEVPGRYSSMAFRPGRPHLALGTHEATVRVLDVRDGSTVAELAHPDTSLCVAWSPDGRTLATECNDFRVRLWDVDSGSLVLPPLGGRGGPGASVAFSADGAFLLTNDWSSTLHIWDLATGRLLLSIPSSARSFGPDRGLVGADVPGGRRVRLQRFVAPEGFQSLGLTGRFAPRSEYGGARFRPDGRLLFVETLGRISIVDAARDEEVATIPVRDWTKVVAFEDSGAFLTSGPDGLIRWPSHPEEGGRAVRIGPPEVLDPRGDHAEAASVGDGGRVAAFPWRSRGILLRRPGGTATIGAGEDMRRAAISPDGRWLAGGNHSTQFAEGARVWEIATGREVAALPIPGLCVVGFSPDGRWLLTTGGGYRLWHVGSWTPGPRIAPDWQNGHFAFAPLSRLVALRGEFREIRLVDPDTGEEVVRLTVPDDTRATPACFSPDGSRLIAVGTENRCLYTWDLRALRAALKPLGLDWNRPDYPPRPPEGGRIEVRVDPGIFGPASKPGGWGGRDRLAWSGGPPEGGEPAVTRRAISSMSRARDVTPGGGPVGLRGRRDGRAGRSPGRGMLQRRRMRP